LEPGQHIRVLVAEDVAPSRKLLTGLLESWGFEVREAVNGQEAVCAWEAWRPHLIWMDIRMPVLDGLAATRQIKAAAGGQAPKIIAITAHAFEEQRSEVLAEGFDGFVRKPIGVMDIADAMARHLGARFVCKGAPDPADPTEQIVSLSCDDLMAAPREWLAALHDVVCTVHAESVIAVIEQIEPQQARLAQSLRALVADYRYDRILSLTEEALAA
jgi:CheY-like chemotaxis protein